MGNLSAKSAGYISRMKPLIPSSFAFALRGELYIDFVAQASHKLSVVYNYHCSRRDFGIHTSHSVDPLVFGARFQHMHLPDPAHPVSDESTQINFFRTISKD